MITYEKFIINLNKVKQRIRIACQEAKRDSGCVQILPVTKRHPIDAIHYAIGAGLPAVGESRVQESSQKKGLLEANVRWELIGHLQTNKAREAVSIFDHIQSVDSLKLIRHLNRHACNAGKKLSILIECNTGQDPNKFGFRDNEMALALETAIASENLHVEGFMTIAPLSDNKDIAKAAFEKLRSLRDQLSEKFKVSLPKLSMGMTGDLEIAIAAGSTQVRVGTALYGSRVQEL